MRQMKLSLMEIKIERVPVEIVEEFRIILLYSFGHSYNCILFPIQASIFKYITSPLLIPLAIAKISPCS